MIMTNTSGTCRHQEKMVITNNAEKFKQIFGIYATELWAMPEEEFLEWVNNDFNNALAEQQWIPCSERLPDEDVKVLVTDDAGGMATVDIDRCGTFEGTARHFWYTAQNVTAWMPLPEPYKEDRQCENLKSTHG